MVAGTGPRLNVWKRLAIVATVLGILGGTATIHIQTMNQRSDFALQLETSCLHGFDSLQDQYPNMDYTKSREKCASDALRTMTTPSASQIFRQSFFIACGLVLAAWALFGLVFVTVRWVLASRTIAPDNHPADG